MEQGEGAPRVEEPITGASAQRRIDALRAVEDDARSGSEMPWNALTTIYFIDRRL